MKKTEKTAMTAALFAAAINLVPSGAVGDVTASAKSSTNASISAGIDPIKDTVNKFSAVYGPAPCCGDVNKDGSVDIFDMVSLRKNYITMTTDPDSLSFADRHNCDVNYDLEFSIADLVVLQKLLLGQIGSVFEDDGYAEEAQIQEALEQSTMPQEEFACVYGPPSWFGYPEEEDTADAPAE